MAVKLSQSLKLTERCKLRAIARPFGDSRHAEGTKERPFDRKMTVQTLTAKQTAFVASYFKTGNASDAYRDAYNAESMKASTVHVKASELLSNGKVRGRIAQVRQKLEEREVLTIEAHLAQLKRLRDLAAARGLYGAAIKAEELRGKIGGFYVERHEVGKPNDFTRMTEEELLESIKVDLADFGLKLLDA